VASQAPLRGHRGLRAVAHRPHPDAIPLLGLLDEALLLPPLILLAVRLIPPDLMAGFREEAARREGRPVSRAGAAVVVGLWLLGAALLAWWLWPARP
jgi:hypothetical protein